MEGLLFEDNRPIVFPFVGLKHFFKDEKVNSVSTLCVPIITSEDHKGIEGVLTVVLLQGGEGRGCKIMWFID